MVAGGKLDGFLGDELWFLVEKLIGLGGCWQ